MLQFRLHSFHFHFRSNRYTQTSRDEAGGNCWTDVHKFGHLITLAEYVHQFVSPFLLKCTQFRFLYLFSIFNLLTVTYTSFNFQFPYFSAFTCFNPSLFFHFLLLYFFLPLFFIPLYPVSFLLVFFISFVFFSPLFFIFFSAYLSFFIFLSLSLYFYIPPFLSSCYFMYLLIQQDIMLLTTLTRRGNSEYFSN